MMVAVALRPDLGGDGCAPLSSRYSLLNSGTRHHPPSGLPCRASSTVHQSILGRHCKGRPGPGTTDDALQPRSQPSECIGRAFPLFGAERQEGGKRRYVLNPPGVEAGTLEFDVVSSFPGSRADHDAAIVIAPWRRQGAIRSAADWCEEVHPMFRTISRNDPNEYAGGDVAKLGQCPYHAQVLCAKPETPYSAQRLVVSARGPPLRTAADVRQTSWEVSSHGT